MQAERAIDRRRMASVGSRSLLRFSARQEFVIEKPLSKASLQSCGCSNSHGKRRSRAAPDKSYDRGEAESWLKCVTAPICHKPVERCALRCFGGFAVARRCSAVGDHWWTEYVAAAPPGQKVREAKRLTRQGAKVRQAEKDEADFAAKMASSPLCPGLVQQNEQRSSTAAVQMLPERS